jgi:hypothetical protein
MGKPIEHLQLEACGVPCAECPVAGLSEGERYAVDIVLQNHGPEIEYDTPSETAEWAEEALIVQGSSGEPQKVEAVVQAVGKIAREECNHY